MTDIGNRLLEVDVYGEFADCPAAAQDFMQALQVKLREAEEAAKVAESHEPVAWMVREPDGSLHWSEMCVFEDEGSAKDHAENPEGVDMTDGYVFTVVPLYTHPPQADTAEIERLRARMAQHVVHSAPQSTMEGLSMGDPEKTDLAMELTNVITRALESGVDPEEVKAILNEALEELEAENGEAPPPEDENA
jgi:hypothetical protein